MDKYKNIIKPVVFLAIFVLLIVIASFIFNPKDNTSKAGMTEVRANGILSEKENSIDVLVIGDSESYTSITPMELYEEYGIASYVMGSNAQKIYISYNFLLEALEHQKPKMVILETNTFFRKLDDSKKIIGIGERYIPYIRFHNRWKNLKLYDFYRTPKYTNRNITKGYYIIKETKSYNEANPKYMWPKKDRWELPEDEEYYIKKIYQKCKENDIELVFYTAPNIKNWWQAKHNTVQDLADELGIDYIDTNLLPEIGINWITDTKDIGDHVNYYGAKKVTKYVGNYLKEKGMPDHRDDPEYKNWDEDLEEYKKILADKNIIKY